MCRETRRETQCKTHNKTSSGSRCQTHKQVHGENHAHGHSHSPVLLANHPCYNADVKGKYGRMHLPVAPRCNIKCNYCNRRFDCHNECRPGVTSEVLTPEAALEHVDRVLEKLPNTAVVGIAGPGDPMANPEATFETFRLVREKYPDALLCLSTNGLAAVDYLDDIVESGVSHITVTVNAIDPDIGAKIYRLVRVDGKILTGAEGASVLQERQLRTVSYLKEAGLLVKVNTVVIPGINDFHVLDIARQMEKFSVDLFNPMPLYPVKGTPFEHLEMPDPQQIKALQKQARVHLPQMTHCARCRADAIGLIGEDRSGEFFQEEHGSCGAASGKQKQGHMARCA